jgi:hypothetical protein
VNRYEFDIKIMEDFYPTVLLYHPKFSAELIPVDEKNYE